MTIAEQFAANLKAARQDKGLSRERLARKADLALDTVFKIEHAKRSPRLETIWALARALETTPAQLLKGVGR